MKTKIDKSTLENLHKALDSANFLQNELRDLYSENNDGVLGMVVYDLIGDAADIANKLKQIKAFTEAK